MFRRFVDAIEVLALVAVAIAVVLLFANEPDSGSGTTTPATPGARLYAANCASCHGADGGGGTGPQLAGGVAAKRFPNVDDQVTFVTDGSGAMPSFGGELSPAEIREVVEYTRTL
jgi:mono/diheme cytochrome c family protein